MDEKLAALILTRVYNEFVWNASEEINCCPIALEYFREELRKLILKTYELSDKQEKLDV